jgi:hypothetical protein
VTAAGQELDSFICDCCRTTVHLGVGVVRPDPPLCRVCAGPFPSKIATEKARCGHIAALLDGQIQARHELPRPAHRGPLRRIGDWFR